VGVPLARNRDFNVLLVGQGLSSLGDAFAFVGLPLLVLQTTGSLAQMGLVTGAIGAARLVAGFFAGALADRVDRRRLMLACDLGRAIAFGAIPAVFWLSGPALWVIYAAGVGGSLLAAPFSAANVAAIANLVDRDQLADANGRIQGIGAVMFLVGPALAGLVSQRMGPASTMAVDAASFIASAASLALLRLRRAKTERPAEPESRAAELFAGVRFLLDHPVLKALLVLSTTTSFVTAAGIDLYVFHLKRDLGQSDDAVGFVFGAASIGAITAAVMTPALRRRFGFPGLYFGGNAALAASVATIGLVGNVVAVGAVATIFSYAQMLAGINGISLRQEVTPDHLMGRTSSAFWTLTAAPAPLGAAIGSALAAKTGAPAMLVAMGVAIAILTGIGLLTPIRTIPTLETT
jgi:MFS family permease